MPDSAGPAHGTASGFGPLLLVLHALWFPSVCAITVSALCYLSGGVSLNSLVPGSSQRALLRGWAEEPWLPFQASDTQSRLEVGTEHIPEVFCGLKKKS